MERTQSTKVYVLDFFTYLFALSIFLTSFVLIYDFIRPYLEIYIEVFLQVKTFLAQNYLFFFLTILIGLILYFGNKSIILKLKRLFSETLFNEDVYQLSLQAWGKKEYDVVYANMRYLVDHAKKKDDQNVYSATAKAVCLFQETSFHDDGITKDDIKKVIASILPTFNYDHLSLNTIHLAYTYLHLAGVEEQNEEKAISHLISAYLFHLSDPKEYKVHCDIETKIFESLYSEYQSTIENLVPPIVFNIMYNKNSDINLFQKDILPYLRKVGEIN